nr:MAG TPA: hypothetical protein [Crassvirales sp.]
MPVIVLMSFHQSLHVLLPNNQQSKPIMPHICK